MARLVDANDERAVQRGGCMTLEPSLLGDDPASLTSNRQLTDPALAGKRCELHCGVTATDYLTSPAEDG